MGKKGSGSKAAIQTVPLEQIPAGVLADMRVISKTSRSRKLSKPAATIKKTRVLVVDDDPTIAITSAEILNRKGYECFAVHTGDDAIAAAESFTPDIVISDVVMPGTNGIDACLEIKNRLPGCRILLFSEQVAVSHALLQESKKAGHGFELLEKPVQPRDLLAKIENLFTSQHARVPSQTIGARA